MPPWKPRIHLAALSLVLAMMLGPTALSDTPDTVKPLDFEPRDTERDREVPVRVYLTQQDSPRPVVLFSHGLGGSREGNPYLGTYWARGGYVCVFMQHAGSDRDVWQSVPLGRRMGALKRAASVQSSRDRFRDVSFVIDQLQQWNREAGHPLHGKLDLEHVGISGHSYGAVTTLAAAGRKFPFGQSFHEKRIDAFLAMSPQSGRAPSPDQAFGHIRLPVLCMTGTKDDSPIDENTTPESRRKVFEAMPAGDKYQLVLEGGHHFTFSDSGGIRRSKRDPDHHPAIQQISLKFWNAYLSNDEAARKWLQSDQVKAECKLKQADVWQWK